MSKAQFGDILHKARLDQGMSLRELSAESGIEFTRLSRMEHGTRPAPGLPQMRRLAELLALNMVDLLVSAGTPREAVEQLLWVERLRQAKRAKSLAEYTPEEHRAGLKNEFTAQVVSRDGAMCTARMGLETWSLLSFSGAKQLRVRIPPEAIHVLSKDPQAIELTLCNVFSARINKIRRIGTLLNLVLEVGGIELNALMMQKLGTESSVSAGDEVFVSISPVALSTEPSGDTKGRK